jgi:rRNA biogenesis protein RRP5
MKKSLINTKLPIICSYNDLQTNLITIGVIVSIQDYGLLVKLFGDLCGLVPKSEIGQLQTLASTNIKSQLQQMFYIGQTVSCKVMNFDEEQKKITLSLKVNIQDFYDLISNHFLNKAENDTSLPEAENEPNHSASV